MRHKFLGKSNFNLLPNIWEKKWNENLKVNKSNIIWIILRGEVEASSEVYSSPLNINWEFFNQLCLYWRTGGGEGRGFSAPSSNHFWKTTLVLVRWRCSRRTTILWLLLLYARVVRLNAKLKYKSNNYKNNWLVNPH